MSSTLTHIALEKAIEQRHPILPGLRLHPVRGKRPCHSGWANASTVSPVGRAILARREHDGWACALRGSGAIVIDLDLHHENADGPHSWKQLVGADVPLPAAIGYTPGGGQHWWYRDPGDVGPHLGILPGVDVCGPVPGTQVVVTGPDRVLVITGTPFTRPPVALLDLLHARVAAAQSRPTTTVRLGDAATGARLRGLAKRVDEAVPGQRNTTLYWAACRAAEFAPREHAEAVLRAAAVRTGLTALEAVSTIASAYKTGAAADAPRVR
ncbi:bifunctional DNA primase/polymerase [Microbacterium sp.]|uniref:bifunctional DNA primase/polymerase n=1 Tax=Microbacterium sp. TaxID=51671 RepID=UPI003F713E5F